MKKILGVLLIAGALIACNNSGEGSGTTDTTNHTADSLNTAVPGTTTVDTATLPVDTAHRATTDSTRK
ncbi:MAG TPA: hypothetical protein VNR87_14265 [Flavisolibacter sp.]|nr:hypothetical protein [Flavisolibacter sp.]